MPPVRDGTELRPLQSNEIMDIQNVRDGATAGRRVGKRMEHLSPVPPQRARQHELLPQDARRRLAQDTRAGIGLTTAGPHLTTEVGVRTEKPTAGQVREAGSQGAHLRQDGEMHPRVWRPHHGAVEDSLHAYNMEPGHGVCK